jgi:hypothetical protein
MIIPLNFEIGNPAVALGGLDSRVPEEILNGYQVGISIQQLGCHRMPELVTGDRYTGLSGVSFHPFLDASFLAGELSMIWVDPLLINGRSAIRRSSMISPFKPTGQKYLQEIHPYFD